MYLKILITESSSIKSNTAFNDAFNMKSDTTDNDPFRKTDLSSKNSFKQVYR